MAPLTGRSPYPPQTMPDIIDLAASSSEAEWSSEESSDPSEEPELSESEPEEDGDDNALVPVPVRSLKGFKRMHLLPGEEKTITFSLSPDVFSVIDESFHKAVIPGRFNVFVGGYQPSGQQDQLVLKAEVQML